MYDLGPIAERRKEARNKLGITQRVAAKRCNVSLKTLKNYEKKGIRDILTLDKMCRCYGITINLRVGSK
ncbi:MAG: helix-turn-helix transcriptional regulator [Candidatus Thiodiazotropha lotti]